MPDPQQTQLAAGARIGGKYRLTRRLGEGAMGVVWAAQNEATLREVALKLLAGAEPQLRMRLLREARACGQLKHRNIVEIYDVGTTEAGAPFLVMELLVGETLAQRLKRLRRLDPAQAALVARDVARALMTAHAKRIIHRDLKPANIFLQKEEGGEAGFVVKVLDFGVSKDLASSDGLHTTAGAAIGSLAYMSPEQARADPDIDHRADLWSMGVVLFEMLAGERPLKGSAPQILLALGRGEIPSVSQAARGLDEGLAAIVDRCLKVRREDRIGSAAELATLLDPYAAAPMGPVADEPAVPLLGEGGTIRMSPDVARQLRAQPPPPQEVRAMEDPATEPTTAPLGQARLPAAPPRVGVHATELMLPPPNTRPEAPRPVVEPPAVLADTRRPRSAAMLFALIAAALTLALVAALVYGLVADPAGGR
jgi:serine/threonine-protein kinase